ncbi:c-di-GMP phosphodiesterase [Leptospira sp. 96542]|nr:c-di-GMP phosphodiesterase [Leptospira sp. 96542]
MSQQEPVSTDQLAKFEFSEESLTSFRKNKHIPIDLYNKDGKIIMPKKRNPTEEDFGKLLKFELQGAYYLVSDSNKPRQILESNDSKNVKLFDSEKTKEFAKQTEVLLSELKKEAFSSDHALRVHKSVGLILDDFTSNPDFESGLFNILEILNGAGVPLESELMTKRTIVAMGMKVRTKKIVTDSDKKPNKKDHLAVMTASFLADIGYSKLVVPDKPNLTKEEYVAIQQHPILSYLMTLSAPEITPEIRTLILNHHRPFRGNALNNNFPDTRTVFNKLMMVRDKFAKDVSRAKVVADIDHQLRIQESNVNSVNFEEDIAILSLASEYASLTTNQPWRPAFDSATSLKIIVNDSFFSYSNKNIRHLLDYVGASLTNNENIIHVGSFVITASIDSEKQAHFDICRVLKMDRYQTRPVIQRICTIKPIFKKGIKYRIADFDINEIRMDKRKAIIDLAAQTSSTQRIVYIIDPELNPPLYDAVVKLSRSS